MTSARFDPCGPLKGTLVAPPDKSVSHRAAILAGMSSEPVVIRNYLDAGDTNSTLAAVSRLGAIVEHGPDEIVVRGVGLRDAQEPTGAIDVGNAGTLMRLLPGWLAAQAGRTFVLDGDASIRTRPVDRIAEPLRLLGAELVAREGRFPPLTIRGGRLHGIDYELPVASAQVKSCILLAALAADGRTRITEREPSRDHTERMLLAAGVPVTREDLPDGGTVVCAVNTDQPELESIRVPGDVSSAAFWVAAAVIVRRSHLVIEDVGANWTRTGFLRILERMGAVVLGDLEPAFAPLTDQEPVTELDIRSAPLVGTTVTKDEVPLAIDELPLVALLGCFAEGETVVQGAQELRVKESDRITSVVEGLRGLGAQIEATDDGFVVTGDPDGLRGGRIASHGDHRLAMLGAIAGLASREGVDVDGMDAAAISYPSFAADLVALAGG